MNLIFWVKPTTLFKSAVIKVFGQKTQIAGTFVIVGLFSFYSFIPSSHAQEVDEKAVQKMLGDFQAKGILNAEQAKEVQDKLGKITPEQWQQIRGQAEKIKKEGRLPAQDTSNSVDAAAHSIDTNSPEFQKTMEEMKKILENP